MAGDSPEILKGGEHAGLRSSQNDRLVGHRSNALDD
jgi:hypothetical protein